MEHNGFTIRQHFFKDSMVILAQPTPLTFPAGKVGPELLMYYKRLARHEPAVIIAGPASVIAPVHRGFSLLRVDQPKYFEGVKALNKILTGNGAMAGMQLTVPLPIPNPLDAYRNPDLTIWNSLDEDLISKRLRAFVKACGRLHQVGFGWIELDFSSFSFLNAVWEQRSVRDIQDFFTSCRTSMGEQSVFSIIVSSETVAADHLAASFLECSGDIISVTGPDRLDRVPPGKILLEQSEEISRMERYKLSGASGFIGVKPETLFLRFS
jgi:hypothetical protein